MVAQMGDPALIRRLMPYASEWKWRLKHSLRLAALTLLIIGWANPQWGTRRQEVKARGVDVLLAIDISRSMWVPDIPPNRITRTQRVAQQLIDDLSGNRIGIVLFAWEAFLQLPLTHDYAAAKQMIRTADPSLTLAQGTDIGEAIRLAMRAFPEDDHHKVLVIFTDGEDHDKDAIQAAQEASEQGLIIFTIGVGTAQGGFIPAQDARQGTYIRDANGQPVRSQLNESWLRQIARSGGGTYFHILNAERVGPTISKRIDTLEKQAYESRLFSEYASYFQYFIAAALLLLLIEFLISYRKNSWWQQSRETTI